MFRLFFPIDLGYNSHMDETFYSKVCDLVRQIPSGCVATYGLIALLAGSPRASRIVGCVMANVPVGSGLPCHRVIYKDGSLCQGNAFGGWEEGLQRLMLEDEGVTFLPDGRVDVASHLWDGPADCHGHWRR